MVLLAVLATILTACGGGEQPITGGRDGATNERAGTTAGGIVDDAPPGVTQEVVTYEGCMASRCNLAITKPSRAGDCQASCYRDVIQQDPVYCDKILAIPLPENTGEDRWGTTENTLKSQYSICMERVAQRLKDPAPCRQSIEKTKGTITGFQLCVTDVAKVKGDYTICNFIRDNEVYVRETGLGGTLSRNTCIVDVAKRLRDSSICQQIEDTRVRSGCINEVSSRS